MQAGQRRCKPTIRKVPVWLPLGVAFAATMSCAQATDSATTAAQLFAGANPARGEQLYAELRCAACHAERMMGSASAMYTRIDRKVRTPAALRGFTQMCVTQLGQNLFPEEVTDIAVYLNQAHYHFK